jgi:hypothetical protein
MAVAERPVEIPAEPLAETGPFKFLDFFTDTPEDRRRFGGREREIRELVARIANEWTLVLYGRSGIGKTSLLLTGIFPELETRGYRPVYARTLTDPIRDLCRAVGEKCGNGGPEEDLRAAVEQAVAGGPLVIVLDQFEEFFIRFRDRPEVRAAFIEAIGSLVNDRSLDVTVVFSLREDWLASLDDFREKIPDLFQNQYRLRPLTAFGVRQAISRPLTDAGIPYDDAVVSKLVDQLEDSGFDPPVLQIICSELYRAAVERAKGGVPRITLDDVHKVGDLDDIFRRCLDGLAQAIPADKALLARMILDALITGDDTKQAVTLGDLLRAQFVAQEEEILEILDILSQQRLLRRQLRGGEPWYELIHERLVPHLKKWLDIDSRFYEFRQARDFVEASGKTDLWIHRPEALLNVGVLSNLLGLYKERFRFRVRELELIFRSSVYWQSTDMAFWAERLGLRDAIEFLLIIAESPNERERNGAAIAAGRLADDKRILAKLCLRLAMQDPAETVRRSAGLSLARLAGEEEILALASALRRKETRTAARQTLTNLWLGGHSLKEFSWLNRRWARRRAERRLKAEHRPLIHTRRTVGIVQGLRAGLIWGVIVVVPFAAFSIGVEGLIRAAAALVLALLFGCVIGALLGGIVASAVIQDAIATREDGHWMRALFRSRALFLSIVSLVVILFHPSILSEIFSHLDFFLYVLLGSIILALPSFIVVSAVLGMLLLLSRAVFWLPQSPLKIWRGSLLASVGNSGLIVASLRLLALLSDFPKHRMYEAETALLAGLIIFASLVAISSAELKHPLRLLADISPRRRLASRIIALVGILLWAVWLHYSMDSLPELASSWFQRFMTPTY